MEDLCKRAKLITQLLEVISKIMRVLHILEFSTFPNSGETFSFISWAVS